MIANIKLLANLDKFWNIKQLTRHCLEWYLKIIPHYQARYSNISNLSNFSKEGEIQFLLAIPGWTDQQIEYLLQ